VKTQTQRTLKAPKKANKVHTELNTGIPPIETTPNAAQGIKQVEPSVAVQPAETRTNLSIMEFFLCTPDEVWNSIPDLKIETQEIQLFVRANIANQPNESEVKRSKWTLNVSSDATLDDIMQKINAEYGTPVGFLKVRSRFLKKVISNKSQGHILAKSFGLEDSDTLDLIGELKGGCGGMESPLECDYDCDLDCECTIERRILSEVAYGSYSWSDLTQDSAAAAHNLGVIFGYRMYSTDNGISMSYSRQEETIYESIKILSRRYRSNWNIRYTENCFQKPFYDGYVEGRIVGSYYQAVGDRSYLYSEEFVAGFAYDFPNRMHRRIADNVLSDTSRPYEFVVDLDHCKQRFVPHSFGYYQTKHTGFVSVRLAPTQMLNLYYPTMEEFYEVGFFIHYQEKFLQTRHRHVFIVLQENEIPAVFNTDIKIPPQYQLVLRQDGKNVRAIVYDSTTPIHRNIFIHNVCEVVVKLVEYDVRERDLLELEEELVLMQEDDGSYKRNRDTEDTDSDEEKFEHFQKKINLHGIDKSKLHFDCGISDTDSDSGEIDAANVSESLHGNQSSIDVDSDDHTGTTEVEFSLSESSDTPTARVATTQNTISPYRNSGGSKLFDSFEGEGTSLAIESFESTKVALTSDDISSDITWVVPYNQQLVSLCILPPVHTAVEEETVLPPLEADVPHLQIVQEPPEVQGVIQHNTLQALQDLNRPRNDLDSKVLLVPVDEGVKAYISNAEPKFLLGLFTANCCFEFIDFMLDDTLATKLVSPLQFDSDGNGDVRGIYANQQMTRLAFQHAVLSYLLNFLELEAEAERLYVLELMQFPEYD
jgi:hypothetical protein